MKKILGPLKIKKIEWAVFTLALIASSFVELISISAIYPLIQSITQLDNSDIHSVVVFLVCNFPLVR